MPPSNQIDIAESERLKALGNEHYRNGEHAAAQHKFTEAIKKNPTNAVLYANRAAVLLAKKQYMDAAHDCRKAVDLDPSYAKAWGRLGSASFSLNSPVESLKSYTKALSCLPQAPNALTPTEQALKTQFTEGATKANVAIRRLRDCDPENAPDVVSVDAASVGWGTAASEMPWDRADALFERKKGEFEARGKPSCVMIITQANGCRKEGMADLADVKILGSTPQGVMERRHTGVLESLSNSILTCDRVFHSVDINGFIQSVEAQTMFENRMMKGWVGDSSGPENVKVQAVKRLKKEGRDAVRKAITVTVRAWIFQGMLRARMFGHRQFAHDMYTNALEILEWGMKEWSNVPTAERGAIFERTFIRGVKRVKIENMLGMTIRTTNGDDCPFTLQDIIDVSEELVEDCNSDKPKMNPMDLGTLLAFWQYPKGIAHSAIGWCTLQQSLAIPETDSDDDDDDNEENAASSSSSKARRDLLTKAALNYRLAAEAIPTDDECHVNFLRKHLECLSDLDAPLKDTLPIARRVLAAAVEAMEIWGSKSFMGDMLQENLDDMKGYVEGCKKDLEEGVCGMDGVRKVRHRMRRKGEGRDAVPIKVELDEELKALVMEDEGEEERKGDDVNA